MNSSPPPAPSNRFTRRRFLAATGAGVVGVAGAGALADYAAGGTLRRAITNSAASSGASQAVPPPAFSVLVNTTSATEGDFFFTDMADPAATMLADPTATTLWSGGGAKSYTDLRLQHYQGRPVITWWESHSSGLAAYGDGRCVVTDLEHNEIAAVEPHNGVSPDEHEFLITPWDTAYIVSYVKTKADLRQHGGSRHGYVMNGIFEEVDLATGKVLFHWESLDHVALSESHAGVPEKASEPWDYFHINSAKPTLDGNVVISARHTWGVYKVDMTSGKVIWRLGGKKSDFDVPTAARFAWQHDAQMESPNLVRMFDNGSDGTVTVSKQSQILWLALNESKRTVTLKRRLVHPDKVSTIAMGNAQRLANGNVVVGWGTAQRISEFSPQGDLVFDATLPNVSYRTYRAAWR